MDHQQGVQDHLANDNMHSLIAKYSLPSSTLLVKREDKKDSAVVQLLEVEVHCV